VSKRYSPDSEPRDLIPNLFGSGPNLIKNQIAYGIVCSGDAPSGSPETNGRLNLPHLKFCLFRGGHPPIGTSSPLSGTRVHQSHRRFSEPFFIILWLRFTPAPARGELVPVGGYLPLSKPHFKCGSFKLPIILKGKKANTHGEWQCGCISGGYDGWPERRGKGHPFKTVMEHKAMIYGDVLSAFWEKEAHGHIAKKCSHWASPLINAVGTPRVGTC